jgi:hypothetical protein
MEEIERFFSKIFFTKSFENPAGKLKDFGKKNFRPFSFKNPSIKKFKNFLPKIFRKSGRKIERFWEENFSSVFFQKSFKNPAIKILKIFFPKSFEIPAGKLKDFGKKIFCVVSTRRIF